MLYLFGKKLGTQHYPTVAGVGYTTPTYEIMDVGCWVHNNQLYKSWLLGTQQPTNFRRCVVLCWFLLVQPMSGWVCSPTLELGEEARVKQSVYLPSTLHRRQSQGTHL